MSCLRRALAPDSDSVIYQDRVIHVASWAARFLFTGEDLNRPVGRLSGGERARVLIAQLMLQPADVLLLDEPTNDLDIPTLEILEESLLEFTGALVLVTHDRFLLDRVSTIVFGLDGLGGAERFADYFQWEEWKQLRTPSGRDTRWGASIVSADAGSWPGLVRFAASTLPIENSRQSVLLHPNHPAQKRSSRPVEQNRSWVTRTSAPGNSSKGSLPDFQALGISNHCGLVEPQQHRGLKHQLRNQHAGTFTSRKGGRPDD